MISTIPRPDELHRQHGNGFYVITVGREVGIFTNWLLVHDMVSSVPGNVYKKYDSWDEALEQYKLAYDEGNVGVIPCGSGSSSHLFDNSIPLPENLSSFAKGQGRKYYYAVTLGRKVGITDNWDEAEAATKGVSRSPPKFKEWDDAWAFYKVKFEEGKISLE